MLKKNNLLYILSLFVFIFIFSCGGDLRLNKNINPAKLYLTDSFTAIKEDVKIKIPKSWQFIKIKEQEVIHQFKSDDGKIIGKIKRRNITEDWSLEEAFSELLSYNNVEKAIWYV